MSDNNVVNSVTITSRDGSSTATFLPQYGGVVASLRLPGCLGARECLYVHEHFWEMPQDDLGGGLPFVFPVFARLERQGEMGAYRYDGKIYRLPMHGFAWHEVWTIESHGLDYITLRLTDNARTRLSYPFRFSITLTYRIERGRLSCSQEYLNCGAKPMPYSAGFHPYFATPPVGQGKAEVQIEYSATRRFLYNERLTDVIAEAEPLTLPRAVTDPALQEVLSQLGANKQVTLRYPDGDALHFCAEGVEDSDLFSYLQLYTQADKPFFCAEPITSPPNSLNTVAGMRWLAPGQSERGLFTLWLNEP